MSDDLTEFKKKLSALEAIMEEREAKMIEIERKALILSEVLGSGNVVNGEQIAMLIDQDIKLENGKLVVINNGQIKCKRNGWPMTVEELISEFLKENPHFVRKGY